MIWAAAAGGIAMQANTSSPSPTQQLSCRPDRAEFEALVLARLDELFGAALRLTRSRSDAEDLVQEAVMRAYTHWHRFEPGTNARAWMHRIVVNTFINGYRRRRREREILEQLHGTETKVPVPDPGRPLLRDGVGDEVQTALAELSEDFRLVVQLVDGEGMSYQEVADIVGCPIGTVMSRLHRARRALRRRLRGYAAAEGYVQARAA